MVRTSRLSGMICLTINSANGILYSSGRYLEPKNEQPSGAFLMFIPKPKKKRLQKLPCQIASDNIPATFPDPI